MADRNGDDHARRQQLGIKLQQRRALLDPRWRNRRAFADDSRLNYRLLYDIEEALRANFGTTTLTAVEVAYQLRIGSIAAFLAGGELEPAGHSRPAGGRGRTLPTIEALADPGVAAYRAVVDAERDNGMPPRSEQEQRIWDSPRLTEDEKRRFIAELRWVIDGAAARQASGG